MGKKRGTAATGYRWTPSRTTSTNRGGDIVPRPGIARDDPRIGFTAPDAGATTRFMPSTVTGTGVTPTGSGLGAGQTDLTTPLSGFGKPFMPGALETVYNNPEILAMQAMKNLGYGDIGPNQGLYQMMRPQMDYANWLAALALGTGADLGAGANTAALNWMGDYAQQLMTPGGQGIDFNAGMRNLSAGAGDPNSVISQFLNYGTPEEQVSAFKSLALPLAAAGLHPFFARAFQNSINQAADQYLYSSVTNPQAGNFAPAFARQSPFL
jgi:hypothetical protein